MRPTSSASAQTPGWRDRVKYLARNVKRRRPAKPTIHAFRDPLDRAHRPRERLRSRPWTAARSTPSAWNQHVIVRPLWPACRLRASVSRHACSASRPPPSLRPTRRDDRGRWLQARMLWLICGLATLFGCFYSLYFLSIGFYAASRRSARLCVLASVAALRYARSRPAATAGRSTSSACSCSRWWRSSRCSRTGSARRRSGGWACRRSARSSPAGWRSVPRSSSCSWPRPRCSTTWGRARSARSRCSPPTRRCRWRCR